MSARPAMQHPIGTTERAALAVLSPGCIDMAGIAVLARALDRPVASVARLVYGAPGILARDVPADRLPELVDHCETLGLEVAARSNDAAINASGATYALAVHIEDPARVPHAVETLARLAGLSPDVAFRVLATPPGQVLGGLSEAAAGAVAARFGPGCEVRLAREGTGPYDAYIAPGATMPAALRALAKGRQGPIPLGLSTEDAAALHSKLPRGTGILFPRAQMRLDIVLDAAPPLDEAARAALASVFDIPASVVATVQDHAPLALAERLEHDAAIILLDRARSAGLPVSLGASEFETCDLVVRSASDRKALAAVLRAAGHSMPDSLPARVARGLCDLDARWLAYGLERVGASVAFAEPDGEGAA